MNKALPPLVLLIAASVAPVTVAQDTASNAKLENPLTKSFPGLAFFNPGGAKIHHVAKGSKQLVDANKNLPDEEPVPVLESHFGAGGKMCRIGFTWGPSDDPGYSLEIRNANGAWVVAADYLSAETLIVPGNGFVYTAGRANAMFDKRRKYKLQGGKLVEIVQPLYRVDIESKVKKLIELRSEPGKGAGEVIARIDKGATVHVLVNKDDSYLVSTPFGLSGWVYIGEVLPPDSPLTEIYFAGD